MAIYKILYNNPDPNALGTTGASSTTATAKDDKANVKMAATTTSTGQVGDTNDNAVPAPKGASANSIQTDGEAKPTTTLRDAAGMEGGREGGRDARDAQPRRPAACML